MSYYFSLRAVNFLFWANLWAFVIFNFSYNSNCEIIFALYAFAYENLPTVHFTSFWLNLCISLAPVQNICFFVILNTLGVCI